MNLTIKELHELLVSKKVTSEELVLEAIAKIKSNKNNLMEAECFEEALNQARKITEVKAGEYFKGIPFLCKDNISTKGIETTASSDVLLGYKPIFDAEVITRLKDAGAILLGKTTLDELAMGGTGTSGHKGVTTNPYDDKRLIGGSSCGSAAALAAGIVPFALGSDTGDSVRKPASYGGLVGIKPTWGRISRFGLFSFSTSLDSIGYFTRSVEDARAALKLLAGHDEKDMTSSNRPVDDYLKPPSGKKNKLAYFKNIIDNITDTEIKNKFYQVIEGLRSKGYVVEEYVFPQELLNAIYPTYMIISCAESTSNNANLDGIRFGNGVDSASDYEEYIRTARNRFSNLIKRRFVIGNFSLLSENQDELFHKAQKVRRAIVNEINNFFKKYDAFILVAAPTVAPLVKSVSTGWSTKPDFLENHLGLANLSGTPSLTLPIGLKNGLPYAINITTNLFEEKKLFDISSDIEDITKLKGLVCERGE